MFLVIAHGGCMCIILLDKEIENMYTLEEINQLPLSTAHMKVLKAYLSSF